MGTKRVTRHNREESANSEVEAEFQKIVDHRGARWAAAKVHPNWGQYYALAYLGMARGYALSGQSAKARKSFEDFFALWKDADRDLAVLRQANAEYEKLR